MSGQTQNNYDHSIPKSFTQEETITITFHGLKQLLALTKSIHDISYNKHGPHHITHQNHPNPQALTDDPYCTNHSNVDENIIHDLPPKTYLAKHYIASLHCSNSINNIDTPQLTVSDANYTKPNIQQQTPATNKLENTDTPNYPNKFWKSPQHSDNSTSDDSDDDHETNNDTHPINPHHFTQTIQSCLKK